MKIQEARDLGNELAHLINEGQHAAACARLAPVLDERTPFRILDIIGAAAAMATAATATAATATAATATAAADPQALDPFLARIAGGRTMGGWVVIGSALGRRFQAEPDWAFARCRGFIIAADAWYAADSLAERLPGPALAACFEPALALLAPWREDPDRWVRRSVGVAVHFWSKRAHGLPQLAPQAGLLLDFLEPLFEERDPDAVKGIGWGLKTLGRYYPVQAAAWLEEQVIARRRSYRAVILRKALTYLPPDLRRRVLGREP